MILRHHHVISIIGLAMLVVTLTGCAGASAGPTTPILAATVSASDPARLNSSPTPMPTTTAFDASAMPVAPRELAGPPSGAAAAEVVKYFFSLFPYIQATGDLSRWDALTGYPCTYCGNVRSMARDIIAADHHSVGGEIEFLQVDVHDYAPNEYAVLAWYVEHPSQVLDSGGRVVKDFPDTLTASADMHVSWRHGGWKIDAVVVDVYQRERR